ncbi:MAG: hypothetical protein AB7M05_12940 [Alphaproteobacteria bacterium]
MKRETRAAIAVCLVAAVIGLYGADAFLVWRAARLPAEAATRLGLENDPRSIRELIRDMARDGKTVVPALWPALLLEPGADGAARSALMAGGRETVPAGGVSGMTTVMCREVGPYVTYLADRHGFNNPDSVWDRPIDLMLIGDSFAQGQCVPTDAQMATRLRGPVPGTVTLGMGHEGPLLELVALKEFGPLLKPRAVMWLYFQGNDLIQDLQHEQASPLLMRYLEPGFSQELPKRQAEIDAALRAHLEGPSQERDIARKELMVTIISIAKLRNLRRALGATRHPPTPDIALFTRILLEARRTVADWGGTLYFVYLPSWSELMTPAPSDPVLRDRVLAAARETGLDVIDLYGPMTSEGDPSAFFFYPGSHYGPEGQAAVADAIFEVLNSRPTVATPQ